MESPNKNIKLEHSSTLSTDDIPTPQLQSESLSGDTVDENVELLPEDQQYHQRYQLTGHKKAVSSVKFSPDGKYLASACTIQLQGKY
jgi:WD40 repeat protein